MFFGRFLFNFLKIQDEGSTENNWVVHKAGDSVNFRYLEIRNPISSATVPGKSNSGVQVP
jgi:hypothetical protein